MSPSRAVGIDLGTTRCVTARIDEHDRSAMVRDHQGDLLIPSVVHFEDDELMFGRAARQAAVARPDRTAEWMKRELGQPSYSRAIGGELLPVEVIEGCLLKWLCTDLFSEARFKPAIVLSVPASFDQAQRRALGDAAQIAGLDLLSTINDPLAAALAFAVANGYLNATAEKPGCRLLVFDLGGGTCDVAIVEIKPGRLRTLAVGGDARMGGRDWDLRLADYLAEEFAKEFGEDPRYDMVSVRRLVEAAEEAKQTLTARQQARVRVERFGHGTEITLTRQTFEDITADLVERTQQLAQQALDRAGMAWRDVAHLLPVGAATRMPMIGRMLETLTGLKPAPTVHPDEAVARGAALYARQLLARREKRPVTGAEVELTDLSAHSLGVEWLDPKTQRAENVVIIRRGSELPASTAANVATTVDGQGSIVIQLLEGDGRDAEECSRVARLTIRELPARAPRNTPVEVHYQYTAEGRLQVKAHIVKTKQALTIDVARNRGLTETQVADWKKLLAGRVGLNAILAQLGRHAKDEPAPMAAGPPSLPVGRIVDGRPPAPPPGGARPAAANDVPFEVPADPTTAWLKKRKTTPRQQKIKLAGHVIFAVLGLMIGYYIVMLMDPGKNWLHLRLPGLRQELTTGSGESPPAKPR